MSLNAIEDTLYAIGGKWKLKVIVALQAHGAMRFNELQRTLPDITPRVLSRELKGLELNGFVTRTAESNGSYTMLYRLTEYSNSLNDLLRSMMDWGSQHRQRVKNELKAQRKDRGLF